MKILKRVLPIVLAVCLLASLGAVSAIDAGETRTVIGADLTDDQIKTVYKTFGIERGSVKELTVTNQDERQYLSGVISDAQIGTKAISCISIEVLAAGKGMTVNTSHITYCTSQMYISALATAGIMDAKISVAAPFDVSGTAALTGIYKAYEDITGTKLDETAKAVSSQELATTAELAQAIGDYDSVEIVNELKLILNETKDMTDAELRAKIKEIAAEYNVTLTDDQMTQLVNLCRSLEKLDTNALLSKVHAVQDTLTAEEITYDKLVELEKDTQGNVTAVRSNVAGLNRFRTALTARIDENLADLSVEELGIPVGSVVLPELFSGMGPRLVVRVLAVRTSDAAFRNRFSTVGINQTLHQIFIDIHVTVTILSLAGTQELAVDVTVLAAETVIVGNVPSTYIGLGGPEEEGT